MISVNSSIRASRVFLSATRFVHHTRKVITPSRTALTNNAIATLTTTTTIAPARVPHLPICNISFCNNAANNRFNKIMISHHRMFSSTIAVNGELRDKIRSDLTASMKQQEKARVSTLRMLMAAITTKDKETGKDAEDSEILAIIQKLVKQREESAEIYDKGNRPELAEKEREEKKILEGYLPQQLSEDQLKVEIQKIVQELHATSMKEMGKVMKELNTRFAGQFVQGATVSNMVKAALEQQQKQ
eukprot:GEZU01035907.1.p1 GENE.GEZU01035907.1~~GEZU01035907.1.p1  ORF type:complete len:245 (-),score=94.15 GEZU01035907.1:137-871(-)